MKPIEFPEKNRILLKPADMTDKECCSLPVYCDGKQCISLWKLSWKERLQSLFYGRLWVYVLSGNTQPPIAFSTKKTVFENKKAGD